MNIKIDIKRNEDGSMNTDFNINTDFYKEN
jgi:hypothetical protein